APKPPMSTTVPDPPPLPADATGACEGPVFNGGPVRCGARSVGPVLGLRSGRPPKPPGSCIVSTMAGGGATGVDTGVACGDGGTPSRLSAGVGAVTRLNTKST